MNGIAKSVTELIGKTPVLEVSGFMQGKGRLLVKLEYFNPAGSTKDRAALFMIEDAEKRGLLKKGGLIIEPTSGNTGIGLACVAASRGYKVVLTMPDTMSLERRRILSAYGAQIVLTEGSKGMAGAIEKAKQIAGDNPGSFLPGQFENPANPHAHYMTTGPEIWEQTEGRIDVFVAGVGTGGTITGVGRYLKEKAPGIEIVAVEPKDSPVLSEGRGGAHGIQGIGAGFVPKALDTSVYDRIVTVTQEQAYEAGRRFARTEGILVGISSGAALCVAGELAASPEYADKTVLALLPDTGDRYLSTPMFSQE